jgi:NAD(P)-dependent dehydrogenase (short-subunit alcohol dehydrogenase family)
MNIFQSKVILITGASSGIGRGLALKLADLDAKVINADIQEPNFSHPNIQFKNLNVADYEAFSRVFEDIIQQYNRIDYVFNNAGIGLMSETQDLSIEQWRKVVDINLMGVINGTKIAYEYMTKQGSGHIINTASLAGLIPFPTAVPYATTKHAIVGLSKSLRSEGVGFNIKVSAICPGFIATNIYQNAIKNQVSLENVMASIPFKLISTEQAVTSILKGVIKNKELIIFPFSNYIIMALVRWFPNLVNRYLFEKTASDFRKNKA